MIGRYFFRFIGWNGSSEAPSEVRKRRAEVRKRRTEVPKRRTEVPKRRNGSSEAPSEQKFRNNRPIEFGDGRLFNSRDSLGAGGFPISEWNTASPPAWPPSAMAPERDTGNAWLYTLDPILVTIIVMSSLGVVLGAVCAGLLLYCTCSYGGLPTRSSTTLENYNFELYDGLKHKVKLNQQRCCTEA
ncbi:hypothetical protein NHX12_015224 [Muraenolepis orangiensis]|uniref:Neuropilin C-terminal domain-containing protein n=1 Tax=Muraenolepis orangiensis TaxID=630683 RepID=A0A9Q0DA64_9TELE|nr:hypothetical protein NHX12_015224 [Muraenolepis orangiensis]